MSEWDELVLILHLLEEEEEENEDRIEIAELRKGLRLANRLIKVSHTRIEELKERIEELKEELAECKKKKHVATQSTLVLGTPHKRS